jgi:tetratricopeptide (TPR) repeat protein
MSQSKAQEALPHLEDQLADSGASRAEVAQAAWMYAKAIYLLNRDTGSRHTEMAERAVQVARESQDKEILSRALLECARAGVESGSEHMIWKARKELRESVLASTDSPPPVTHYVDSFCSYHLLDIGTALVAAERAVEGLVKEGSIWEVELAYTALGNCNAALCRFERARSAYDRALQLSKKMGNDCRISIVSSNLCASYLMSGDTEHAIPYGEESLRAGRVAPTQPTLVNTLSNLAFSYALSGHVKKTCDCLHLLRDWIQDRRSWTLTMECRVAIAEIELALGNRTEALTIVAEAQRETQQRNRVFAAQGAFERLTVLLAHHTDGPEAAMALSQALLARYRNRHILAYLEAVAGAAWAEKMLMGAYSEKIREELRLFDRYHAKGKRALIAAQGFLD